VQTLLTVLTQQSPTGLEMLASAQLDHPLDPTTRSPEIPVLGLGCRIAALPDRCW
jgi:hypothetical protein